MWLDSLRILDGCIFLGDTPGEQGQIMLTPAIFSGVFGSVFVDWAIDVSCGEKARTYE